MRAPLWPFLRWPFLFMCGPSGPQRVAHCRRHPCRLGSRCEHHTVGGILAADLQCRMGTACVARGADGVRLRARRLHWRRPRNRRHVKLPRQEAAGALVFARDGSRQDAGGVASSAGRRPAITKPIPRRNFHRGAGRIAGGSERRRTDEGRAAGGGDAATTPQAAHQPKELHKTSRMDAATAPQPTGLPTRVREVSATGRSWCIACTLRSAAGAAQPSAGQASAAWMPRKRSGGDGPATHRTSHARSRSECRRTFMVHCMHPTKRSRRRSRNRRQVKLPRHGCRGSVRAATAPQPTGLPTRVREVSATGRSWCIACTLRSAAGAGRATVGRSSFRGMDAAEAFGRRRPRNPPDFPRAFAK